MPERPSGIAFAALAPRHLAPPVSIDDTTSLRRAVRGVLVRRRMGRGSRDNTASAAARAF